MVVHVVCRLRVCVTALGLGGLRAAWPNSLAKQPGPAADVRWKILQELPAQGEGIVHPSLERNVEMSSMLWQPGAMMCLKIQIYAYTQMYTHTHTHTHAHVQTGRHTVQYIHVWMFFGGEHPMHTAMFSAV